MSDLTLSDGTEITFDFFKINLKEWRGLFDKDEEEFSSDEKIARVCGLTYEQFESLKYPDYHKLMQEFWKKARDPAQDSKNSLSVPT
jgi:hypothetical protein